MKLNNHLDEMSARTGIKRIFWILLGCSLITSSLLGLILITKTVKVQTVLVPPEISRTITISNTTISKEYLEEMGVFLTQLLLNATPTTVEKQNQILLNYVAPEYYQALSQELIITEKYIKKNNLSTFFIPRRVTGYDTNNTIKLEGQFIVAAGDKIASKSQRTMLITLKNNNGKISVISIKEERPANRARKADQDNSINTVSETVISEPVESVDFRMDQMESSVPLQ